MRIDPFDLNPRQQRLLWSDDTRDKLIALGVIAVVVGLIGYLIWFHMHYMCVASHTEHQQHCDTTCFNSGNNNAIQNCSTSCYPIEVEVCDKYVPRENGQ